MLGGDMFKCTVDNCKRSFDKQQGLSMHIMRAHEKKGGGRTGNRKKEPGTEVVKTRPRRNVTAQQDAIMIVQLAFPKGIPTEDRQQLLDDLDWIARTGEILQRR
jgi:hypothetical protein